MSFGLYVHVPFCHHRCHFCAFYLEIHRGDRVREYLASLEREIELHARMGTIGNNMLGTIYFGGGTPTTLSSAQLCNVLGMIRRAFQVSPDSEVTVEAHPDTAIPEELSCLAQGGFTRISFGIQSTQDEELVRIGRPTTSASARSALRLAREAGFTDINVDLIHGLPGQTLKSWRRTVQEAVDWGPDHVSSYALTVEDHSHLQVNIQRGIQSAPDPSLQNQMEDEAALTLAQAGFEQYEISNYSQPHRRCRHNTLYWTGQDYLGIGPSAQSYVDGTRFGKTADLDQYNRMLHSGTLPIVEAETLSVEQRRREEAVFGLRLSEGIASNSLGIDLEWNERITRLMDQGLLQERAGRIRLTAMGRRFADSVAVELL